jgi:hypothetical protein
MSKKVYVLFERDGAYTSQWPDVVRTVPGVLSKKGLDNLIEDGNEAFIITLDAGDDNEEATLTVRHCRERGNYLPEKMPEREAAKRVTSAAESEDK